MSTKNRRGGKRIDLRLVVGVILVVTGGLGTTAVVAAMDQTTPYLSVVRDVVAGEIVTTADFAVIDVHSRSATLPYLPAHHLKQVDGAMITQSLQAGELIPQAAVISPQAADATTLTVSLGLQGAPWLRPGAVVDVWISPAIEQGFFGPPRVVAPGAVVVGLRSEEGFAADPSVVTVDLRVGYRDAPAVIGALANAFPIALTPVHHGGSR